MSSRGPPKLIAVAELAAHADPNAITQTWPHIARVYPTLLITVGLIALVALGRRMPFELVLYTISVLLSTLLLGAVHHWARRLSPDLAHVLADAAVAVPMALILVAW